VRCNWVGKWDCSWVSKWVATMVAEPEIKYPTPTQTFPKFPTPDSDFPAFPTLTLDYDPGRSKISDSDSLT